MYREEINNVLLGQTINYEGVFSSRELFKLIDTFLKSKGYQKKILNDNESQTPNGRQINLKIRPYNKPKGDIAMELQIFIKIKDMVDTIREIDDRKVKFDRGKITIIIDAFLVTNLRGKWESRAEYYLIRTIFDKYLFKPDPSKYLGKVKSHAVDLKNELHGFLNLYKFLY
ncbi:hypothetical protein HOD20_00750 [archaeon]|jgi:hypothetical protein|nr:hypothetical protein [archaeon]MBT4647607.1 hypothetical protein [archaeon]MBT6821504.1 hypothetical protein [archaeon]MBT7391244.1 hypothetical protein [archaeon]